MAEFRESSILFSLGSLFDRERERVAEEAERECRRIEAEQLERLERERRLLEQQESLRREEEARARRDELRSREKAARIDALRAAEVARACAEAEAKARIELDATHREHELRLTSIRENARRRRAEQLAVGCAIVAFASWAAGAWLYFGLLKPERELARVDYETSVGAERDRSQELRRLLDVSERRNSELAASLKRVVEQPAGSQPVPPAAAGKSVRPGAGRGEKPLISPTRPKPGRFCPDTRDPIDGCL